MRSDYVWMGASDALQEGSWMSHGTNINLTASPHLYTNWMDTTVDSNNNDYSVIHINTGKWRRVWGAYGTLKRPIICEKHPVLP